MIKFESKMKSKTVGQIDRTSNESMTLADFENLHKKFMYDKTLEGLSLRTLHDHEKHFKWFFDWLSSTTVYTMTDRLDNALFKDYIHHMVHKKKYSKCTVNLRLRTLKCYLKWLYDNEYTILNYSMKIKLLRTPDDKVQPIPKEDIKKVLLNIDTSQYAGFRDSIVIICILDTGIRINELLQIKVNDIDFKNSILRVRAEVSKTRSERLLPLSNKTLSLLKQLANVSKDNGSEIVFLSSYSIQAINPNNVLKNFERYARIAGVKTFTPYKLRHTFAVEAVRRNVDIFTIQRIMGHNNITTTRQYIQLNTEDIKKKHNEAGILNSILE